MHRCCVYCKYIEDLSMFYSMFYSQAKKMSRARILSVNYNKSCSGSGFVMSETVLACSSVTVVYDMPCCPAVWQDDGPQTAAARSTKSLTCTNTHAHTDTFTHLSSVFPPIQYTSPLWEMTAWPWIFRGSFLVSLHFIFLKKEHLGHNFKQVNTFSDILVS